MLLYFTDPPPPGADDGCKKIHTQLTRVSPVKNFYKINIDAESVLKHFLVLILKGQSYLAMPVAISLCTVAPPLKKMFLRGGAKGF